MAFRHLQLLCCAVVSASLLSACQEGRRLRKANVDQVTSGMAKKQVESILGMPTTVETKDFDLTKKTTYTYTQENGKVTIVFWDDRLETKESTINE
ncbi:MAG: outer membrane protein assembly factor BamE [Verrucomicrobiota bacterium]|nr:outer membrane protein assembly factor BamE [Verrucomicrobiota bacterium]